MTPAALAGTLAKTAPLEIQSLPLRKSCPTCGKIDGASSDFDFRCRHSHAPVDILSGREMRIEYSDLDEPGGPKRRIEVGANLLRANAEVVAENRKRFRCLARFAINLTSAPGAGKTAAPSERL